MRRLRQSINQPRRQGSQRRLVRRAAGRCGLVWRAFAVDAGTDCVDDTGNLVTRNPGKE